MATDPNRRWKVDLPVRDYVQQALDREKKAYLEQYGDAAEPDSLLWRPVEDAPDSEGHKQDPA